MKNKNIKIHRCSKLVTFVIKGKVHTKTDILLSLCHLHVITNLCDFFPLQNIKEDIFNNVGVKMKMSSFDTLQYTALCRGK